jgi:WD40 repeat protein
MRGDPVSWPRTALSNKSLQRKSSSEDKAMSDPPAGRHGADDNLLYGMLALQMNFVGRDALLAAMQAWVFDKSKPLGQILQEQGRLTPERRQALDQILAEHLKAHDDDAHQSLRAMSVPDGLRDDLCALSDSEVQASLATATDPDATRPGITMARPGSGRFHVLRPHARGGLGELFVALDQELHREVALKEIQARFAGDAESRGRFVQEAEITGGLEHPGIVPVYGLGTYADGRPYYAMRLIQGETLRDAIRKLHADEPGLTLRGLLTRFVVVCNAVAYAHSRGVLHRDLKPANVMLGKYGETLVVDWGLAKAVGSEVASSAREDFDEATLRPRSGDSSTDTQMGSAIGTPGYMSPEQAAGRLNQLGPATDVYGLGATMYTILTGKTPVAVPDSAAVLGQVQHGAWPPPCQVNKRTPAALDAVCRKAMALRPEDRYPTVLALAADVEAWLADEPVAAHVEPWASRALRWMRRRQKLVTAAAAIVVMATLALGVGVVLLTAANERERDLRGAAELKEEEARQQRDEAQRRRDEAWYNLYVANMNLAQREWDNGNLAHVRDLLDQCIPHRAADKNHRGWEWFYQDRLCHGALRVLRGHAGAVAGVAYSPDGSRLATAGKDGTVRVWDVVSGTEVRVLDGHKLDGHKPEVESLAFSPDGTRLASAGRDHIIRVWEAAGDKKLLTIDVDKSAVLGLAYSPDGSRLASASASGIVRLWDAATGAAVKQFNGHLGDVYSVAYSPDGKHLASAGRDGTVRVWGVADGRELFILRGHTGRVRSVAYSPDGSRLASAGEDGTIYVWNTATGAELGIRQGSIGLVYGLAFSPDGTRLASAALDGTVRVWDAVGGHERHVFRGHTGRINSLAYSADGTRLASAGEDGTARVWDAAGAGEPRLLKGHTGMVQALVYSPDGTQLTSTGQDGTVRIWDTALGREVKLLKAHTSWINGLAYSPDRTRLATACNDGAVRVWDLVNGGPPLICKGHDGAVNGVAQSPDGAHLATVGSDGTLRVWDAKEGTALKVVKDQPRLLCLAYSPKGGHLAWAGDKGVVHIWDMVRGEEVRVLQGHAGSVLHLAYSRDGSRLASSGRDGTVRVWDMVGDRPPRVLRSHTNDVNSSAFNPDGSRLASAGDDGTVRLWDLAGGGEVCVLKNRLGEADAVAFSPDGTCLAFSSVNGVIQIVDARPWTPESHIEQEALALVEDLFGRPLLKVEVLAQIEGHKGITEVVRRRALELCGRFHDEPERFDRASRNVVRYPAAPPALVRKALGWAQTACALAPDKGACLTALGIAQYRMGQYAEALATLGRAEKLNQANPSKQPADIAFQAMAHQRLGHTVEAQAALNRLRDLMKSPPHSMHEEALAFLAEAETLIAP